MANDCSYAGVLVKFMGESGGVLTYQTDAKKAGATNSSPTVERRTLGTFTCNKSDLLAAVPALAPKEVDLGAVGNRGYLYLRSGPLGMAGTSSVGTCHIRGSVGPLLNDEAALVYKWPDCLPIGQRWVTYQGNVVPTKVVLVYPEDDGTEGKIDLLDPADVAGPVAFDFDGTSEIKLPLTPAGLAKVGSDTLFPSRILVSGSLENRTIKGRIDLRNQQLAGDQQTFLVDKAAPLKLRMTTSGFAEFGASPQELTAAIDKILSAIKSDSSLGPAIDRLARSIDALRLLHHAPDASRKQEPASDRIDELLRRLGLEL
jgi:hypothetical protein